MHILFLRKETKTNLKKFDNNVKKGMDGFMLNRIEFFGIPGAGKTTLCKLIYKELKKYENIELYNIAYKKCLRNENIKDFNVFRFLRFYIIDKLMKGNYIPYNKYSKEVIEFINSDNHFFTNMLKYINNNVTPTRRDFVLKYFLLDIYKWNIIVKNNHCKQTVLMDEGFVQRALNIYMNIQGKNIEDNLDSFFNMVSLPSVVVYVSCDVRDSLKRMSKRKRGIPEGFRNYSKKEFEDELKKMILFSEMLISYLSKKGVKVINVTNDNLNDAKTKILDSLK